MVLTNVPLSDTVWRMKAHERTGAVLTEIRAEMARQRRTQAQLAEHLNITQASLSRRFNGVVPITYEEVASVEEWLGLSAGALDARATSAAPR